VSFDSCSCFVAFGCSSQTRCIAVQSNAFIDGCTCRVWGNCQIHNRCSLSYDLTHPLRALAQRFHPFHAQTVASILGGNGSVSIALVSCAHALRSLHALQRNASPSAPVLHTTHTISGPMLAPDRRFPSDRTSHLLQTDGSIGTVQQRTTRYVTSHTVASCTYDVCLNGVCVGGCALRRLCAPPSVAHRSFVTVRPSSVAESMPPRKRKAVAVDATSAASTEANKRPAHGPDSVLDSKHSAPTLAAAASSSSSSSAAPAAAAAAAASASAAAGADDADGDDTSAAAAAAAPRRSSNRRARRAVAVDDDEALAIALSALELERTIERPPRRPEPAAAAAAAGAGAGGGSASSSSSSSSSSSAAAAAAAASSSAANFYGPNHAAVCDAAHELIRMNHAVFAERRAAAAAAEEAKAERKVRPPA
jgi:hypothetical protein